MPPNVILGPPNITESTRAKKVEIKNTTRYCEVLALRLGVQDPLDHLLLSGYYQRWAVKLYIGDSYCHVLGSHIIKICHYQ